MSKNSCTFNFEKDGSESPARFFLVVYSVALFLTLGAIFLPALVSLPNIFRGEFGAIDYSKFINGAPDERWYLAHDFKGDLEHDVLYYNFEKSIENIRKTDILILGSSRVQFGFHYKTLESFEVRYGVKFFNMGLGYWEGYLFPLLVMEKYNLNPKMVIVNAEAFSGELTPVAEHIIAQGKFRRGLTFLIRSSFYKDILVLHSYVPEPVRGLLLLTLRSVYDRVWYRSRTTGMWFKPYASPRFSKSKRIKNTVENDCKIESQVLENARRFKDEMDKRGTQIVLTLVPHDASRRNVAEKIAAHIQVPFIFVDWDDMSTYDGSHLTEESAQHFTERVLRGIENSPPLFNLIVKTPLK
ncbi:MAG TPA: hypothetical protein VMV04_04110 [Thermodesulfobacteriota bacterium]|nr:hypothetical protein [Thermodesulfobacteriota bacterium]